MMKEVVVTHADAQKLIDVANKHGHWKLACMSNTGLDEGLVRLTFLPVEAFVETENFLKED